jgi:hypothetical protein
VGILLVQFRRAIKYAARHLSFAGATALALALAIGASGAIFDFGGLRALPLDAASAPQRREVIGRAERQGGNVGPALRPRSGRNLFKGALTCESLYDSARVILTSGGPSSWRRL